LNSMNVAQVGKCSTQGGTAADQQQVFNVLTEPLCTNLATTGAVAGATWTNYTHNLPQPVCQQVDWSRVNHLGNGLNNQPLQFNWTIPPITQVGAYTLLETIPGSTPPVQIAKCVLRMRYNISTDDYDPRNTNASNNDNPNAGVVSPVTQDPTINIGLTYLQGLQLAIDTTQFGRTFQDRSHTWYLKSGLPASVGCNGKILNLNVRGKRGNIVETYPAVEYDFQPNQMVVNTGDCIIAQWTGSNTHNNGNPAGDGQAGDAGEGTEGTDRHNIVCLGDRSRNYPVAVDLNLHNDTCMFTQLAPGNAKFFAPNLANGYIQADAWNALNALDAAFYLGSSGFYTSQAAALAATTQLDVLLDNTSPSLMGGVIIQPTASGKTLHYMCTRNNNFSNRSQKGSIQVL